MIDVVMPQMGESIVEGTLTRWLKNLGDKVERDEPLFEISTDKVDTEIPSPAAGVLSELLFKAGDVIAINTVVARIGDGAAAPAAAPAPAPAPTPAPAAAPAPPAPAPEPVAAPAPAPAPAAAPAPAPAAEDRPPLPHPLPRRPPTPRRHPSPKPPRSASSPCRPCARRSRNTWCTRNRPQPTSPPCTKST